jgi:hypothetical protein
MNRSLIAVMIGFLLVAVARPATGQQTKLPNSSPNQSDTAHDDKIFSQVFKLGVGHDVTVRLVSGKERHGRLSSIEENGFRLVEVDLEQVLLITYRETNKVYAGYTQRNVFGKRINPQTRKISRHVVLAVVLGVLALVGGRIR